LEELAPTETFPPDLKAVEGALLVLVLVLLLVAAGFTAVLLEVLVGWLERLTVAPLDLLVVLGL
jgi:hypothetical protein